MAFYSELKRRHVVQVGIAYLVVAWGAAQVCELVLDTFETPAWVMQAILAVLALGFPLALVLAWLYQWRRDGIHREQGRADAGAPQNPEAAGDCGGMVEFESIAVLPFVNMSSDPEQEYFSDGIAEELLNLLARIPELRVAARTSAFSFKGKDMAIPEIARQLRVAHVLEGSVRKAGNRIRITAQLIRADGGYHMWSESWDRTLDDIFAVQDEIAAEVVQRLKLTMLPQLAAVPQTDPRAYAYYLEARHLSRQHSAGAYQRALELLEQALAIAPDFAAAWAERAAIYTTQTDYGLLPVEQANTRAREAIARALAADPDCAQAEAQLGRITLQYDLDFTAAARHYLRALSSAPSDLAILAEAALLAMMMTRFDTARGLFNYLLSRDPVSPTLHHSLGRFHICTGDIDAGIASFKTALRLQPDFMACHSAIAMALLSKGEPEAALASSRDEKSEWFRAEAEARIYHAMGRQAEAEAALSVLLAEGEHAAINIAGVVAEWGQMDRAFEWLEVARRVHDTGLKMILVGRSNKSLRTDPRWGPFLARIGMSPEKLDAIPFDVRPPAALSLQ